MWLKRTDGVDMKRAARFTKVSMNQFKNDWEGAGLSDNLSFDKAYEAVKLPVRATKGSAGYDIFSPIHFKLEPGRTIIIPTGIRCEINEGWVLKIYPRSGLGFKFRLQLNNTVGIIDSDYYYSNNEGHIFIKITNDSREDKTVSIDAGTAFAQGIFLEYGITYDDQADGIRNGGFGSTSKNTTSVT